MVANNFDASLKFVLQFEGGFVDHPKDPGGATNLGVTIHTLSAVLGRPATKAEVKALTPKTVAPIYRQRYWDKVRGDDLPLGIDLAVFDFGVHSGPKRGAEMLQRVLGVSVDGDIGDVTLKAARQVDAKSLIKLLCTERLKFLKGLTVFKSFGKGLTSRVEKAQAAALSMVK
jgi:lysozyme family protein